MKARTTNAPAAHARVHSLLPLLLLLVPARGQDPAALAATAAAADQPTERRCEALVTLHAAAQLTVPTVLHALGSGDAEVARTAAAIVRHTFFELPPELFAGLDADKAAARVLLEELALAPRPAAAAWAVAWGGAAGRSRDDRCLALAAAGAPLGVRAAQLLLDTLAAGEAGDGFLLAMAVLPPATADALVGRVHLALQAGQFPVAAAAPLFDRLSAQGARQLLGLALTLPPSAAEDVLQQLCQRDEALVRERAAFALRAATPLEPLWLPYLRGQLQTPADVERVVALLDANDPPTQLAAFDVLLGEPELHARVLAFAVDEGAEIARVRRLLAVAVDAVPAATLDAWIRRDAALATEVASALCRRSVLTPELAATLRQLVLDAGTVDGPFAARATAALLQRGGPEDTAALWPLLRASDTFADHVYDLGRRRAAFVPELLLTELAAADVDVEPDVRERQRDALGLALVAGGDRRELVRLLQHAPRCEPAFVRRVCHHVRPLAPAAAVGLLRTIGVLAPGEALPGPLPEAATAMELAAWAATAAADPAVADRFRMVWRQPPDVPFADELREQALAALAEGPHRAELLAALQAALAKGPLPDELESVAFALLAGMPTPLSAADLRLCFELMLVPGLRDPQREAALNERWPDGSSGFPLVQAAAQRLRGGDPVAVAAAAAAATASALADPNAGELAPGRLLALWRLLQVEPELQRCVGAAMAPLGLQHREPLLNGAAAALRLPASLAAGGHVAAARQARLAIRELLLRPERRQHARWLLGERDPSAGLDPWAALAALPFRCELSLAEARGEAAAAAAAAAAVREFAGHDRASLDSLPAVPEVPR